jgi:DNA-binding PadR family transcriptional regulator
VEPGAADWAENHAARFEFAPPRHFVLPAILLLLSEQPGYGYLLVKELHAFGFGRVDRPSVYRALAQLRQDGLVECRSEAPTAGQARQVYSVTERGERVLRSWMGVIKDEISCLERVVRRYRATGSTEAVLAEVKGAWSSTLGSSWPSASSASPEHQYRASADLIRRTTGYSVPENCSVQDRTVAFPADVREVVRADAIESAATRHRFRLVPDRSVVLVEARSSVGPISFGGVGIRGFVEGTLRGDEVVLDEPPTGYIEIDVASLSSGNGVYDAELLRRIDARRYPHVKIELRDCVSIGSGTQFCLTGVVDFHGVTQIAQGSVTLDLRENRRLVVTGEQAFDIRDFNVASPTVLMLRIYPDVKILLHIEADIED